MRTSRLAPNAVFPDTRAGREFARVFYPTNKHLRRHGVEFCGEYSPDGPGARKCRHRDPSEDYPGRQNWCRRCSAGYMQEELIGMDTTKREQARA